MNRLQRKISHLQNILNTKYLAPPLPPLIDVHTEYMILKARPPPVIEPPPVFELPVPPANDSSCCSPPPPPSPLLIIEEEREVPLFAGGTEVEPVDEFTDVPEEEIEQREAEQKALEDQLARLELEKLVKKKPRTKKL